MAELMTSTPDYFSQEEFQNRSRKLAEWRQLGINPYPYRFEPTHQAGSLTQTYQEMDPGSFEEAIEGKTQSVRLAGRLVLFRPMGKNTFAHLQDETGRFQVLFNAQVTQVTGYHPSDGMTPCKLLEKKIDLGDFLGVEGHLFRTKKGELTVLVKEATLLCKTLLPLADKHSGLADKELRYRKRWLDLITNSEVRDVFRQRSEILRLTRRFLEDLQFIEVETPIAQSIYGGAKARPFKTVLNCLDQEMFLRISLEIALKKLIVGGLPRVFEIGKVFRNENIDHNHNPEFTLLEAYAAYWDYNDVMRLVENLVEHLARTLHGTSTLQVTSRNGTTFDIDLKAPWIRMTMKESLQHYAHIDVDALSDDALRALLEKQQKADPLKLGKTPRGLLIAELFEALVQPHLIQPHHITDHPVETTPLCKPHRDDDARRQGLVERFESFIVGEEMCNAYSELNDPELQRFYLEEQAKKRESGDEEASPLDEEFLEAICQGMPPTGGIGIGIDRLVMLLTHTSSIRDVLLFPWMKPL